MEPPYSDYVTHVEQKERRLDIRIRELTQSGKLAWKERKDICAYQCLQRPDLYVYGNLLHQDTGNEPTTELMTLTPETVKAIFVQVMQVSKRLDELLAQIDKL